jgi:hypothetical protein
MSPNTLRKHHFQYNTFSFDNIESRGVTDRIPCFSLGFLGKHIQL